MQGFEPDDAAVAARCATNELQTSLTKIAYGPWPLLPVAWRLIASTAAPAESQPPSTASHPAPGPSRSPGGAAQPPAHHHIMVSLICSDSFDPHSMAFWIQLRIRKMRVHCTFPIIFTLKKCKEDSYPGRIVPFCTWKAGTRCSPSRFIWALYFPRSLTLGSLLSGQRPSLESSATRRSTQPSWHLHQLLV